MNLDYLNQLAHGLKCNVPEILHFDLEINEFSIKSAAELAQKNQALEAENSRLQQFVNWLTEQLQGGGETIFK